MASRIEWEAPVTGTYYAMVRHWSPAIYGCDTGYRLTLAETTIVAPLDCIPPGWTSAGAGDGQWQCQDGALLGHSSTGDSILVSPDTYTDVTLSATVSTINREASLAIRLQDAGNGYFIIFIPDGIGWNDGTGGIWLQKRIDYVEETLGYYHGADFPSLGEPARLSVSAVGSTLQVTLNEQRVLSTVDMSFASGHVGLRIYGDSELVNDASFSNLVIEQPELRPDIYLPQVTR